MRRLDGRNPNSAGPAVAETNSTGDTNSAGATNPQSPQTRKLLLLLLLALGHRAGDSKDQTGVGMEETGVGMDQTGVVGNYLGIGVHIDRSRGHVCVKPMAGICENFSQWDQD